MLSSLWMLIGVITLYAGKFRIIKNYGIEGRSATLSGLLFVDSGVVGISGQESSLKGTLIILAIPVVFTLVASRWFRESYGQKTDESDNEDRSPEKQKQPDKILHK